MDERTAASWEIQPHTEAKHALLSAYLKAWFPILSLGGFERVIYIDGFAGPGRYSGGQDGSPVLALRALAEQSLTLRSTFEFHFVERKRRVADTLKANIADLRARGLVPSTAEVFVHERQTFEAAYDNAIRPRLLRYPNAPAFALVDPFGWTGIPMKIVSDMLRRPSTEVLVNFMFEEINRFLGHVDQPDNFDALFGGSQWRIACSMVGEQRKRCVHDYYRDQLAAVGEARFVRSFEMRNERGLVDYFLFFATKSPKGLAKMKEAMWRVDPAGGVTFSDATDPNQTAMFAPEPNRSLLRSLIEGRFAGRRARVSEVEAFVVERTPFLATHYKKVLKEMEAGGSVIASTNNQKRKPGTFPDPAMVLAFQ